MGFDPRGRGRRAAALTGLVSLLAPVLGTGRAFAEPEEGTDTGVLPPEEPVDGPPAEGEPSDPGGDEAGGDEAGVVVEPELVPLAGESCVSDLGIAKVYVTDELRAEFGLLAFEKLARLDGMTKAKSLSESELATALHAIAPSEHETLAPWAIELEAMPEGLGVEIEPLPWGPVAKVDEGGLGIKDVTIGLKREDGAPEGKDELLSLSQGFQSTSLELLEVEPEDLAGSAWFAFVPPSDEGAPTSDAPAGLEGVVLRIPVTDPTQAEDFDFPDDETGAEDIYDLLFGDEDSLLSKLRSDLADKTAEPAEEEHDALEVPFPGAPYGTLVVELRVQDPDEYREWWDGIYPFLDDGDSIDPSRFGGLAAGIGPLDEHEELQPCVLIGVASFEPYKERRRRGPDSPVPTGIPSGESPSGVIPRASFALAVTGPSAARVRRRFSEAPTAA